MLRVYSASSLGRSDHGWLQSQFHFSFSDYHNPDRMGFGVLRVVNDDWVAAHRGFATHPHRDMEIISYVLEGELTHKDSMGHESTLQRGEVQYMSAGTGVTHSEMNHGAVPVHLFQIWILPDRAGHEPRYGEHRFAWEDRHNQWLTLVTSNEGAGPVRVHQDVCLKVVDLQGHQTLSWTMESDRQAYAILLEGQGNLNGVAM